MSEPEPLRILFLEDRVEDVEMLVRELRQAGVECLPQQVETEAELLARLAPPPELIVADHRLPGRDALAALRVLRARGIEVPVIVISDTTGEDAAVECLREGAADYLLKDRLGRLGQAVRDAVEQARRRAEQRRSAEALQASEERHQKLEAIGQLAGGIAHDFNNLLTTILGYAGLVTARARDRLDLLGPAEEIRKASERAAALTRQLLAFSRQQALQPRVVDLNEVIACVEAVLRRLLGERVILEIALQAEPCLVLADPGQLEQVLVNLALNARDAMPDGGRLAIETAWVEVAAPASEAEAGGRPGPHVRLAVRDTGSGMDAATRARIFEPFFTTKERGRAAGLGLATVSGIVRQSGGHLAVASAPGSGSTFEIYLPRVAGLVERSTAPAVPAVAGGAATVLVVEDNALLRQLVRIMLEAGGFAVLEAETAVAAIALAESHPGPIQVVVTDVVMPGMSGPEVAARLVALRPQTRVLFTSGFPGGAIGSRNLLPPGARLLGKPFTQEGLLRQVREILRGAGEKG